MIAAQRRGGIARLLVQQRETRGQVFQRAADDADVVWVAQIGDKCGLRSCIRAHPRAAGKANVLVHGKGGNLRLPTLPLTAPVTLQLQGSSGECWTAEFSGFIWKNDGDEFVGRSGSP